MSRIGRIIAIHKLPNISRSKSNQAMKYGQLILYKMSNIFLVKSYTKCGEEASPSPIYNNSKLKSLDQQSEIL